MDISANLNNAITALENAIVDLRSSSDDFYSAGDNYRGNIRFDAAAKLQIRLDALREDVAWISNALAK